MSNQKMRLGDMLLKQGVITEEQLLKALEKQKKSGDKLGVVLLNDGIVTEKQIMNTLQVQLGIPYIDLQQVQANPMLADLIPFNTAQRHEVAPFQLEQGSLKLAMEDPLNFVAIDDIRMLTNLNVIPYIATRESVKSYIQRLYGNESAERAIKDFQRDAGIQASASEGDAAALFDEVSNAPIVRLVNSMIEQAVEEEASDIHIEPMDSDVRVRFRVDGRLMQRMTIPKGAHAAVVARIKILGGMNIAERRLPQDGRLQQRINHNDIDFRLSVLPTVFGEKVVIRILNRSTFLMPKERLGFSEGNIRIYDELLKNPYGMILITGPTGSGKTTTLYTMLHELNRIDDNIITVEDPVEFMMRGLNQVQVNAKAGLTFASGLRSILRQDPDIIMIGEMRDHETVEIAIRAAITGHLVLSTLHTNDAAATITRLLDMGVQPYLLSSALVGIISQRLLRRLCTRCSQDYTLKSEDVELLGFDLPKGTVIKKPIGCSYCNNTGYKGRIAVHEILAISNAHRRMINSRTSIESIREYSIKNGMSTIGQECFGLLMKGITSFEEVIRVAYSYDNTGEVRARSKANV